MSCSRAAAGCSPCCATISSCSGRSSPAARAPAARARCCVDGRPVNSCLLLAEAAAGHEIVTIEGLSTGRAAARAGGVRRRGRAPVRVLHARARSSARRRCSSGPRSRPASRSTRRWPATSAAAAPIRRSSARSCAPPVPHDARFVRTPDGDGGALRGRLGARRRDRRRRELGGGRRARARRQAGAAPRRGSAGRRARRATRSTCGSPGCSTPRCCARPSPTDASARSTSRQRGPAPGVRAAIGPESELSLTTPGAAARRRAGVRGPADRRRRGGHARRRRGRESLALALDLEVLAARRRPAGGASTSSASRPIRPTTPAATPRRRSPPPR